MTAIARGHSAMATPSRWQQSLELAGDLEWDEGSRPCR